MSHRIRWLLLLPSAIAGAALPFLVLALAIKALEVLCPVESRTSVMTSGMDAPVFDCSTGWYGPIRNFSFFACLALANVLAVLAPVVVAPKHKAIVGSIFITLSIVYVVWAYQRL
jgi:hypothetical protein